MECHILALIQLDRTFALIEGMEGAVGDDTVLAPTEDKAARADKLTGIERVSVQVETLAGGGVDEVWVGCKKSVAGNSDISRRIDVDEHGSVTDHVTGDGHGVDRPEVFSKNADVGASGGERLVLRSAVVGTVLDSAAGDGDFGNGARFVFGSA